MFANNSFCSHGEDYVDAKEFRSLLVFLRDYYELHVMFQRMDSTQDGKLDYHEFRSAVPQLRLWGATGVPDSDGEDMRDLFASVDVDGHGAILFDEFCVWAINQKLDLEEGGGRMMMMPMI